MDKNQKSDFLDLRKYKVIKRLGQGSFGNVYKVQNIETGEVYAAKVSKQSIHKLKNDTQKVLFLFREVKIMSSLNHPAILQYFGYSPINFNDSSKPTIVLEFLPNGTLNQLINFEKNGLSSENWGITQKLICIYGIASGMSYLHHNNIIHRDLKPDNILMDQYLHPKIADFGLSKIINGITESLRIQSQAGFKGTYLYSAPEVCSQEDYSEASDVYSFSMIVYEIMNVENSFDSINIFDLLKKILEGFRPKIDEIVPDCYKELIEDCWSQDPKERPTFDEIVDRLKNNRDFITSLVDENEFIEYVDFIDNYKTSFDLSKCTLHMNDLVLHKNRKFKRMRIQQNDDKIINIVPDAFVGFLPLSDFNKLNSECQNLVNDAENNIKSQYSLGVNLIEGINGFDQNIDVGMKYLQKSRSEKYENSIIYLSRLFIDGTIVQQDLNEASIITNEIEDKKSAEYFLLFGIIAEKKENYSDAIQYYQKSIKLKNAEAMFCFGKLLFDGKGVKKDEKKAKKYFDLAKKNGFVVEYNNEHQNENDKKGNDNYLKIINKTSNKHLIVFSSESDDDDDEDDNKVSDNYFNYDYIDHIVKYVDILTVGDLNDQKRLFQYYLKEGYVIEEFVPVGENYGRSCYYNGIHISITFYDIVGMEEDKNRVGMYDLGNLIILHFSLLNIRSFQNIFDLWLPESIENTKILPVFILVGTEYEKWIKDPNNPNYVQQTQIDAVKDNKYIYKTILCSYLTSENMNLLSDEKIVDYYYHVKYPELYKKIQKHKISQHYNFPNRLEIQVFCIGNNQSGVLNFLQFISKGDPSKIIETVEDFEIIHVFDEKNVILHFSQGSFETLKSKKKSTTQVFLLIFSMINKESFLFLAKEWVNNMKKQTKNKIILVGVDRENWDDKTPSFVQENEMINFATNIGAYKVVKCSYATGNRIEYLKNQIVKSIVSKK